MIYKNCIIAFLLYTCMILCHTSVQGQANKDFNLLSKDSVTFKKKLKKYLNTDSSYLNFKHFKATSILSYEFRYNGLQYDDFYIKPISQNLYIHNQVSIYNLPFDLDFNYGNGYLYTQRKMSNFSFKFNPSRMLEQYSEQLIEQEKKRLMEQLESDTNFGKYMQAVKQLEQINSLMTDRNYMDQINSSSNILKSVEQSKDSLNNSHNTLIQDSKNNLNQYKQMVSLQDSLQKFKNKTDQLNPLYKTYTNQPQIYLPEDPSDKVLMGYLQKSTVLPSYMKWMSHISKFEIGVVYPSNNTLVFNGAALKGLLTKIETKHSYTELIYGRQLATGNYFHDTFAVSNNKVLYVALGYQSKYIKVGGILYYFTEQSVKDTLMYKFNFSVPRYSVIPGVEFEANYKKLKGMIRINYVMEDLTSKTERFENEMINKERELHTYSQNSLVNNISSLSTLEYITHKKGPKLTLSYKYSGKDYYSSSAPFAAPFNDIAELKIDQSLFNNKLTLVAGGNYRKNLRQTNTAKIDDRTFSGFFSLNLKASKKLPTLFIRYMPMYRVSVWEQQSTLMQINQLTASLSYNRQVRKQLYVCVANYTNQELMFTGNRQVNRMLYIYQMFKPRHSSLQYSLMVSYFDKPVSITTDSVKTLGAKIQINYQRFPTCIPTVYIDYSSSPGIVRQIVGTACSFQNKYIGTFQIRCEYGQYIRTTRNDTKGMNISATLYRKII